MCMPDPHNLIQNFCLLFTLLLMNGISAANLQDEQPLWQAAENRGNIYRRSNTAPSLWMTTPKRNDQYHDFMTAVAEMPDYILTPYNKRGTTYKKFAHGKIFASNIRPFQQLGHYSTSLNRRRLENQKQKEPIQLDLQPLPPSPVTTLYNNREHDPLTPMALSQTDGHERDNDNKRTVFLSSGWAPSGLGEINMKINAQKQEGLENKKTIANSYAFTSNHWGPMGKREDIPSRPEEVGSRKSDRVKEKANPDDVETMGNWVEIGSDDVIQPLVEINPTIRYFNSEVQLDSINNISPNPSIRPNTYFIPLNPMSHWKRQAKDSNRI